MRRTKIECYVMMKHLRKSMFCVVNVILLSDMRYENRSLSQVEALTLYLCFKQGRLLVRETCQSTNQFPEFYILVYFHLVTNERITFELRILMLRVIAHIDRPHSQYIWYFITFYQNQPIIWHPEMMASTKSGIWAPKVVRKEPGMRLFGTPVQ